MTLKTRNRFLLALDIMSFLVFSLLLSYFVYFVLVVGLSKVPNLHRIFSLGEGNVLIKNSPLAAMISSLLMPLYVTVFGLFIYLSFEKTKAPEIIYIALYFIGCAMQGVSLLIIALQMWDTSSIILICIARVALSGHILSAISILLLTLMVGSEGNSENKNYTDRNIWIAVCVSLFCASIIPINTTKIFSTLWLTTGFDKVLAVIFFMVLIASIVVFSIYSYYNNIKFFSSPALYLGIFELGYLLLFECDNYLFLVLGSVLFFVGTYFFLKFLRKKYRWN